jgi:polyhydroxybutyrate depolymerase
MSLGLCIKPACIEREAALAKFMAMAALALATLLGPVSSLAAQERLTIETRDGARTALFYPARGAAPLIIALHGGGGTGERFAANSGLPAAAKRGGAAIVFPDGVGNNWNDGRGQSSADDFAFFEALIGTLAQSGAIDPRRVFVMGMSNGGMMALAAGCRANSPFRGVGVVAASLPAGIGCSARTPQALILLNGTDDRIVPYDGGSVGVLGRRGEVIGTQETLRIFVQRNGCQARPAPSALPDRDRGDGSTVTRFLWSGCRQPIALYRVDGGGHTFPGDQTRERRITGAKNRDINGAVTVISFLLR